jgi:hypothetical protein
VNELLQFSPWLKKAAPHFSLHSIGWCAERAAAGRGCLLFFPLALFATTTYMRQREKEHQRKRASFSIKTLRVIISQFFNLTLNCNIHFESDIHRESDL